MNQTFSNRYLILVVFIFTLASTFSIIDRQILNVMIGPIKRDLGGISDTQVSLIMGFAFALFYTLMTYPAGRIADRYNRIKLMTAGIAGWSFMTMMCGAASQYWQLFLARMGVGVGEARPGRRPPQPWPTISRLSAFQLLLALWPLRRLSAKALPISPAGL